MLRLNINKKLLVLLMDSDKKSEKLRARNDFIMRRMMEAEPKQDTLDFHALKPKNSKPVGKMTTISEENTVEEDVAGNKIPKVVNTLAAV